LMDVFVSHGRFIKSHQPEAQKGYTFGVHFG